MAKNKVKHKRSTPNPVLQQQAFEKRIEDRMATIRDEAIEYGMISMKIITIMVLHDKMSMNLERSIDTFNTESNKLMERINGEFTSLPELISALHEETGYTLTVDEIAKIDPQMAAYLQ